MSEQRDLAWARDELPTWKVQEMEGGLLAYSPTAHLDGVMVAGRDPEELVARVRRVVRVIAMAMQVHGRLPVGGVVAGVDWRGASTGAPAAQSPPDASPAPRRAVATLAQGLGPGSPYAHGLTCTHCGSMTLRRAGTCYTCDTCGEATGCG